MALIELVDKNTLIQKKQELENEVNEFSQLNVGTKAKAADKLFLENKVINWLGGIAENIIEKLDIQIEHKDNMIGTLKSELKLANHYDEKRFEEFMNRNPVTVNVSLDRERVKKRFEEEVSNYYK